MSNPSAVDQVNEHIESMLANADGSAPASEPELCELMAIAAELRTLPDPDFKSRLKAALFEQTAQADIGFRYSTLRSRGPAEAQTRGEILPTLFGKGHGAYPVHRSSFVASALAHMAAVALLITVGIFAAQSTRGVPRVSTLVVTDISPYVLPAAPDRTGGGGGGGDHDVRQASNGTPPRFAKEQMTPPAIVVRNENPNLSAEPTVVGPPNLSFPQTGQMGDPLSGILRPASNGSGSAGGIGNGLEGGVGAGKGPGVGPGNGGGIGGGPYHVGGGVTTPRAIYDPDPEYSEEARKAKYQGVVVLRVVIGSDGRPQDIWVAQSLGMGLDEKAIEAIRRWRFEPAQKDNQPVAVLVDIQVNFRLY